MKRKAVFLDRDGTLNEEMGYINHISRFKIFPFTGEALRLFKEAGYLNIVITNQAGVARGYFDLELVHRVHDLLREEMARQGAIIDDIYFCPHHPVEGKGEYKKDCPCRKPRTGMIEKAVKEWDIDLSQSLVIGDRFKDMLMARNAGVKGVMVLTGYGRGEYQYQRSEWPFEPDYIFDNILEAARFFSAQQKGKIDIKRGNV